MRNKSSPQSTRSWIIGFVALSEQARDEWSGGKVRYNQLGMFNSIQIVEALVRLCVHVVGHDGHEPVVRDLLQTQVMLHGARVGMMGGRGHQPTEAMIALQVPTQYVMLVSDWQAIGATNASHTGRGAGLPTCLGLLECPDVCQPQVFSMFDALLVANMSCAVAVALRGEHV